MDIKSIAFDGMHRSGKGSQIQLLKKYFEGLGIYTIQVRGEYYRKGSGKDILEDPYSLRRQKHAYDTNYEEKSNRLNRELFILYHRKYKAFLEKQKLSKGIIIQDRSIVGDYLFKNTLQNTEGSSRNVFFKNKQKTLYEEKIIPDIIFILKPSKEILLERLEQNHNPGEDNAEIRLSYKRHFIDTQYESYYNGYNQIPDNIKEKVVCIDGNENQDTIHQYVIENIRAKLLNTIKQDNYDIE